MTHRLRSTTTCRPRATLLATVGIAMLLLAAPATANCTPLDELPPVVLPSVGVPAAPDVAVQATLQ